MLTNSSFDNRCKNSQVTMFPCPYDYYDSYTAKQNDLGDEPFSIPGAESKSYAYDE